ncbi:transcriptional regulator [Reichenbachiella sp. 5M10]|uniref:LysR family transcriptional regulator n=1 Tax=Reichenbachiella sp. 5M10 TaxID=1889772 RepID=UPI000C1486D2|nr:LysR family transcriptional regulator [Reichenbachiella sp. 5M10]PIB34927.1 transcriptional regulator [Reichenbachiella sp. 5M10]
MSYQIELRHIRYFLEVAKNLHFRKAAEKLYVSQPGLSRQIHQMEEKIGVQLFDRNSKKVQLTAAGSYLQSEFELLLRNVNSAIDHAQLIEKGVLGSINLGYVGSAMQQIIPDLLTRFSDQNTEVQFNLQEMDNLKQTDALLSQKIDLGFVRLERAPIGLKLHPVLEESFVLVLPADHRVDQSTFTSLTQFKKEHFILFEQSYSPSYYEKMMNLFVHSGFDPIVSHNTVHAGTIYKLVEHHLGVSILPESLMQDNPSVKFIRLNQLPFRTTLYAIWNTENRNPALATLIELFETP